MLAWGYIPQTTAKNGTWAGYLCPWHDDHRPSLVVDMAPRKGATDLGFKCMAGHCGQQGFGSIQLAARLMGFPAGELSKEDYLTVANELAERLGIETEDYIPGSERLRSNIIGGLKDFHTEEPQYADWTGDEPIFEKGEWTLQGLKALGLRIELATRKASRNTDNVNGNDNDNAFFTLNSSLLTQYDPDSGEPLYRCSLGKDYYRGAAKAEARTIAEWGSVLEQKFHVKPVKRFITLRPNEETGGRFVLIVRSTPTYPIFMFRYPWGIKKYEPLARKGGMKWTWWSLTDDADLEHRYYADADIEDWMEGAMPLPDQRHPFITIDKDKDGQPTKIRFQRVVLCSGPRDAIAVWSHTNAHVVWLHSEASGFDHKGSGSVRPNRWLRAFTKKLLGVTADGGLYVCYDEDDTGIAGSQAIALNNPQVRWLRLPSELGNVTGASGKPLKDVTDFITHFAEVERLMPADVQHDDPVEWFDNALFDTPTCQFWQWESERKDQNGTGRARYKFDLRNVPVFLRARGMVRKVMQMEKGVVSRFFLLGNDHTYSECFPGEKGSPNKLVAQAREMMADWLRAHKEHNDEKGSLSRAIYSAKLEQSSLESIEIMDFDDKSYGEDFDHFFFHNTAVRVDKDSIDIVPYSRMKQWTNSEAILDGNFTPQPQAWRVVVNPLYNDQLLAHEELMKSLHTSEERAQENMRWDSWSSLWHYRLVMDKPLEEMPVHFRFLYNTSRIFWEKEENGGELSAKERQAQDMYFIAMLHAIGSALVRHRSANRQQFIHITDNGTRREDLASGGTGKTAILDLLCLMRRALCIDGKSLEGSNIIIEQELGKIVPGLHNIVCLDELPAGFSPKKMYNYPLSVTSRGLYHGAVKLTGDDLPKFVVASNEQMDISSDSTSRRIYQVLVSDWYHPRSMDGSRPAHTPADDFRKEGLREVARNLSPTLLNEARNLMLGCVQLFFQLPDETIRPPKDSRALLRQALAASKDTQFTRWIADYLSVPCHRAIPIAQRELAISLLDYCGTTIGEKTLKNAYKRIRDNLDDYLRTSAYVCNPPVVLKTPTDREQGYRQCAAWQHPRNPDGSIPTDDKGNRLPRELTKKAPYPRVYYFYRKTDVPRHFYDEAHLGDKDYVQPAPEEDPERVDR